jgi:hypothetical protein
MAFFSERPVVDLLGKSDPVVAHVRPKLAFFYPGHNKWDDQYSVLRLRPGVVAQLWQPTEGDVRMIAAAGYVRVARFAFVRDDLSGVDRARLAVAARQFEASFAK